MDFSWSQEQIRLRKAVIDFAQNKLNHNLIEREQKGELPRDLWKACADFGLLGLPFPNEYGGENADILSTIFVMEGLGYGCKDNGLIFGMNAQLWSVQMPIFNFGTTAQKNFFLPKLCSGDSIGAHGMTEPDSGSDAYSLSTTAELRGDYYVLNGNKIFITNAFNADIFIVFATVNKANGFLGITAFILEKNFSGLNVSNKIDKMGLKTAPMAELIMINCKVPVENRLGQEGNGAAIFNDSIEWERICILANVLGEMERTIETCVAHAKQRKQFGKPIGKFQSVANKIVDMKIRLETARLILYKGAWSKKTYGKATLDAAMIKLYLSEAWVKNCLDAVQIFGGYGYTTEIELERSLRDSIGGTIFSGTSDIQRNVIATCLGL